jgi:hypothetical protein
VADWRVGRHYPIHVYEGDTPVATFFTATDAAQAVRDHNEAPALREMRCDWDCDHCREEP